MGTETFFIRIRIQMYQPVIENYLTYKERSFKLVDKTVTLEPEGFWFKCQLWRFTRYLTLFKLFNLSKLPFPYLKKKKKFNKSPTSEGYHGD